MEDDGFLNTVERVRAYLRDISDLILELITTGGVDATDLAFIRDYTSTLIAAAYQNLGPVPDWRNRVSSLDDDFWTLEEIDIVQEAIETGRATALYGKDSTQTDEAVESFAKSLMTFTVGRLKRKQEGEV